MAGYFTKLLVTALCVLPAYLFIRLFVRRQHLGRPHIAREILVALFVLFVCGVASLVFTPGQSMQIGQILPTALYRLQTGESINYTVFRSVRIYLNMADNTNFYINIVGNILLFVPIGFCLPLFWRRWQPWWKMGLCSLGVPLCIEFTQLFIGRFVDIDDVLLNATGILGGYLLYRLAHLIWPRLAVLACGRCRGDTKVLPAPRKGRRCA